MIHEGVHGEGIRGRLFGCINAVRNGLKKYRHNLSVDLPVLWSVWLAADLLVYSVPMFMRLPLDHTIAFSWTMLLSFMRGATSDSSKSMRPSIAKDCKDSTV